MSGRVERAAYLVFGAREVDESDEGTPTFSQFDKDWDAQLEQCSRLAAERGYQPVGSSVFSVLQASMDRLLEWADDPGCDVVLVASPRLLRRMRDAWPDWDLVVARLGEAGARLEAVPFPEPAYPGECFAE